MVAPQLRLVADCEGSRAVVIQDRQQHSTAASQPPSRSLQAQIAASEHEAVIETVVARLWLRLRADMHKQIGQDLAIIKPDRHPVLPDIVCRIGTAALRRQTPA